MLDGLDVPPQRRGDFAIINATSQVPEALEIQLEYVLRSCGRSISSVCHEEPTCVAPGPILWTFIILTGY
jgi:hypothetical protein